MSLSQTNAGRLAYAEQLAAAAKYLRTNDQFLVVSHVNPDGDAASSTFAMGWILSKLGKQFVLVNEGAIPPKFHYMWGHDQIINLQEKQVNRKFDYVITVDCADYSRLGSAQGLVSEQANILNIDHHATNDFFGTVHLIKDDAAATAEIIFDLFEQLQLEWSTELAVHIYTGLLTDTGGFRYSNTSAKVMGISSKLLQYGVNAHQLAENLLEKVSYSHILLLKKALSTLAFEQDRKICWLTVSKDEIEETQAHNEDFEGIVNYPLNIEGVEVGLLFKETRDGMVKVSFRSAGKVDVAQIAKSLGGGGHVRAAGATMNGPLQEAAGIVVNMIKKALS